MKKIIILFVILVLSIIFVRAPCEGDPSLYCEKLGNYGIENARTICTGSYSEFCNWDEVYDICETINGKHCPDLPSYLCSSDVDCKWASYCSSGDCCDTAEETWKNIGTQCDLEKQIVCENDHVYIESREKTCSGNSASCTSDWSEWTRTGYDNDCASVGLICDTGTYSYSLDKLCCNNQYHDGTECVNDASTCTPSETCTDSDTIGYTLSDCTASTVDCSTNLHCFPDPDGGVECRCSKQDEVCSTDADCCSGDGTYCADTGKCVKPNTCNVGDVRGTLPDKETCCADCLEIGGVKYPNWKKWVKLSD